MYCSHCGAAVPEGARVCPSCERPAPTETDSGSRKGLLIAALLALLLVVGGVLWLFSHLHSAPVSVATVPARPVPPGPSVVQTPAAPRQPAPPPPQGMPEDIHRYLAFLQDVEAQRKQYEGR